MNSELARYNRLQKQRKQKQDQTTIPLTTTSTELNWECYFQEDTQFVDNMPSEVQLYMIERHGKKQIWKNIKIMANLLMEVAVNVRTGCQSLPLATAVYLTRSYS